MIGINKFYTNYLKKAQQQVFSFVYVNILKCTLTTKVTQIRLADKLVLRL